MGGIIFEDTTCCAFINGGFLMQFQTLHLPASVGYYCLVIKHQAEFDNSKNQHHEQRKKQSQTLPLQRLSESVLIAYPQSYSRKILFRTKHRLVQINFSKAHAVALIGWSLW